jgi:hypothetical protein
MHGYGHCHETYRRVGGEWLIAALELARLKHRPAEIVLHRPNSGSQIRRPDIVMGVIPRWTCADLNYGHYSNAAVRSAPLLEGFLKMISNGRARSVKIISSLKSSM